MLLGKAWRVALGTSCNPANGACLWLPQLGYSNTRGFTSFVPPDIFIRTTNRLLFYSRNTFVH